MQVYTLVFTCESDPDRAYNVSIEAENARVAWDKLRATMPCHHRHSLVPGMGDYAEWAEDTWRACGKAKSRVMGLMRKFSQAAFEAHAANDLDAWRKWNAKADRMHAAMRRLTLARGRWLSVALGQEAPAAKGDN